MRSHEIDYTIIGNDMQCVEIELDPGESMIAEAGAMNWMDPAITYQSRLGDGSAVGQGFFGKVLSAGKRAMAGESVFLTHFTNEGQAKQRISFASPYPGSVVPLNLSKQPGGQVTCQKDSFLCAAFGTTVDIALNKRLGAGFFGGEGFIMQRLSGDGMVFVHACGTVVERQLAGETIKVDTGCLVGFGQGVEYNIEMVKGLKSMLFGGEGMFLATLTGTGPVWLQTLPFSRLARRIHSMAPVRTSDRG